MAFIQATVWIVGCSALGYFLLKVTSRDDSQYMKELQERSRVGPQAPSGPLGFVPKSTSSGREPSPIVPPTANPFYRALHPEAKTTGVSAEDTNSRKTGK